MGNILLFVFGIVLLDAKPTKMDCGQFFCPMQTYEDDLPIQNIEDHARVPAVPGVTSAQDESVYCCFTIPEDAYAVSMPYCCDWEDYAENLYTLTGLAPNSRLVVAFLPVGIALFFTLVGVSYIVYFICCRLEPLRPTRRATTVL